MKLPRVLTIAGSDSGGGAGIQADLKALTALGVHGMSAITAVTAQNTKAVTAVQDIDPSIVRAQIEAVISDIGVDVVKTGMLHTGEIIDVVARQLSKCDVPLVVDPVMIAKSGARLLEENAIGNLIDKILPLATVLTPNRMEAEEIANMKIRNLSDAKKAAKRVCKMGPVAVVVKGGHLGDSSKVVDTLYYRRRFYLYEGERIKTKNTHGTGCIFASSIAAELAKGNTVPNAVRVAKEFVTDAVRFGLDLGRGHGPVDPAARLRQNAEKYLILENLKKAIRTLTENPVIAKLIPESQSNIAMALPDATSLSDIAAVPGRVVKIGDSVKPSSGPEFGASKHLANTLLAVIKHDPTYRAAMNIRYSEEIVRICDQTGRIVSFYDRAKEPPEVKAAEGRTTSWGAEEAVKRVGRVPDVIYHRGDYGKEPMAVLLGRSAAYVADFALQIARRLTN